MSFQVVVGLIITAFLVILGIICGGNKTVRVVMFFWMIILLCFNTGGSDWENNYHVYRDASVTTLSVSKLLSFGYTWLCSLCKNVGISFETLHIFLGALSTILIYRVVIRYSKRPGYVLALLYLYPFADNIIQKRWYYAMGFIMMGLPTLWEESRKTKKIIKFFIICLVASQFHVSALLFGAILLFELVPEKYRSKVIIFVFAIELILVRLLPTILINNPIIGSKVSLYMVEFGKNSTLTKFIFWTGWHLSIVFIVNRIIRMKLYKEKQLSRFNQQNNDEIMAKLERYLPILNIFSIIIIPFYTFDPVFTRIFRPIIIFDYIYISCFIQMKGIKLPKRNLLNSLAGIGIAIMSFVIFYFLTGAGFDQLVIPLLENNSVLDFLN